MSGLLWAQLSEPNATAGWWESIVSPTGRLLLAVALASLGIWLMLPAHRQRRRFVGSALALLGGLALFSLLPPVGQDLGSLLFWPLAAVTLASALATITSRSAVYSAIWFALALLAVGGLFMLNGAQFLGVATVAVYAGAIVVTFLFVLMLAQPEGHSYYDRVSWGTCPTIVGIVVGMLFAAAMTWAALDYAPAELPVADGQPRQVLVAEHVATLGAQLFGPQLILIEVAGVLLLSALVGAVAMASHAAHGRVAMSPPPGRLRQGGFDHE